MHTETDWARDPEDRKHGHRVWTHTGGHEINDAERDPEISFSDEVLGNYEDDDE
jgi:hypothetical protein